MAPQSFRCCLLGETTLVIQCAELLERRGHSVVAVASRQDFVREWAERGGRRFVEPGPGLERELAREPFDYLFSATNFTILSPELLALPRRAAINFHDSPLPRYAGMHATSWALMRQEPVHGVSWHLLTEEVDRGDVLVQRSFVVSPGETALSLNTACFGLAIEAFGELVEDMEQDRLQPQPQERGDFEYFGRYLRPEAACAIAWERPADEIDALVRALHFGPYPNPLGLPKLLHDGRVFYVSALRILESQSDQPAGRVISGEGGHLVVSTGSQDVEITELLDAMGRRLADTEALAGLGLCAGTNLTRLDEAARERLGALDAALCRHESYWKRRLARLEDPRIPYANPAPARDEPGRYASVSGRAPEALDPAVIPAAFGLYLSRLCDSRHFHLAYSSDALRESVAGFEELYATQVPLEIAVDPSADLASLLEAMQRRLAGAERRGTYPRDLLLREPGLEAGPPRLGVAIEKLRDSEAPLPPPRAALTLVLRGAAPGFEWSFDTEVYSAAGVARMQEQFSRLLERIAVDPTCRLEDLTLMDESESRQVLESWNSANRDYDRRVCIHKLFEQRAAMHPDAVAVVFEDQEIRYGELNERANQLAAFLRRVGVGSGSVVGIFMERCLDAMVGLLGVMKAGAAYLPLDPGYPAERLEFMISDAGVEVLVTQSSVIGKLPAHAARTVRVDGDWGLIGRESTENPDSGATGNDLAYVIYTSGSTGRPKGVQVRHRNVVNFFLGMDQHLPHDPPGAWLALTTLSFDISVLELFWTLTRGFKVVLAGDQTALAHAEQPSSAPLRPLDLSLFYFSSDERDEGDGGKYQLLLEGARFADQRGFAAVWTPERHFHAFGGLYPNPSVTGAALAAATQRVQIRAGSCVLPLHHPLRVAEEWAVVDNLSGGRVGISFASGWQPNDFVLRPESFANAKEQMLRDIETVRSLWRGEALRLPNPKGEEVEVRSLPRPVQGELPVWITAAGSPETFRIAGERGYNLLTHLLGQSFEELAEKIRSYREARAAAGHDGPGQVTLMLHTFVGDSDQEVRETVRAPMREYLRSAVGLVQKAAWTFPTQKQRPGEAGDLSLAPDDMEALLDHAFERYYETSGLFGTPRRCLEILDRARSIGVDEIGCLIDFGVEPATVLEHLEQLAALKDLAQPDLRPDDFSIPAQIVRHQVSHIQCTPSMAGILMADQRSREALDGIQSFLVGGEPLSASLARALCDAVGGDVFNVYGPTETTIWSTLQKLGRDDPTPAIGRPLLNQQAYVVDSQLRPVAVGVPGELLIGGEGVTAGYLGRPELTEERFTRLPFALDRRSAVYRTGDLVRYRADGTLEFVGRVDHQVKIRGHRIEPGEIEAALEAHPGVLEAVVVAREDEGGRRLVAYYRGAAEALPVGELRRHLERSLPEYMLPASFVPLASFPLSPSGKIDRGALPAPAPERPVLEQGYTAPSGALETAVAELCGALLGLEQVGAHDDLFHLGADSILVVHLVSRLRKELGVEVRIARIFESPTVAALARHIEEVRALSGEIEVLAETQADEREEFRI